MSDEISVFDKLMLAGDFSSLSPETDSESRKIAKHKEWLNKIRRERPNPNTPYRIGVYIRYFNQTKYEDYLSKHKNLFEDSIALCPRWNLVEFYIDNGQTPPYMESAPEWSRLVNDCTEGKINLIITQKISNVSRNMQELIFCSRMLAALEEPVGIYFISEDIFTLSSYYMDDLHDEQFLPSPEVAAMLLEGAPEEK